MACEGMPRSIPTRSSRADKKVVPACFSEGKSLENKGGGREERNSRTTKNQDRQTQQRRIRIRNQNATAEQSKIKTERRNSRAINNQKKTTQVVEQSKFIGKQWNSGSINKTIQHNARSRAFTIKTRQCNSSVSSTLKSASKVSVQVVEHSQ